VGGGLGRTPIVASLVEDFLPEQHLLTYLDAVLRVYNLNGRRDNKYKARIKILVKALGVPAFRDLVRAEWANLKDGPGTITPEELERVKAHFTEPAYETLNNSSNLTTQISNNKAFSNWFKRNVAEHKKPGYAIATLTLKKLGTPPGDITDNQMDLVADLADKYSFSEVRSTHEQNLVLADVKQDQLFDLWQEAKAAGFATPNLGLLTDMICCPGGDFCALANAKSIPVAEAIQARFDNIDFLHDLGEIDLNISGCMNACGHHHIGHIGILGVDKKGEEFYQVSLGGDAGPNATIGKILGPSFARDQMTDVIENILNTFVDQRIEGERFVETYRRVGHAIFKERAYAKAN
jgi:sulfite reductase (NADPH) hemoprotein beta-component